MKYRELFHFDPIESVIELGAASGEAEARRRVETYVLSERMGEQIAGVLLPNLDLDAPRGAKGLLLVGGYGAGKSHLLSVLSAVAERAGLAASLRRPELASAAARAAGRFKVVRIEIGAVAMPLRDLVCKEIEEHLAGIGVRYSFPPAGAITGNKAPFSRMMEALREVYPEHGLLLVIDELLDYLRSRRPHELSLDLGFLREIGEICGRSRLRFLAGLQESLFDDSSSSLGAGPLRRVRDRFEEVRIAREDIAHVVAERLVKKDARQEPLVREHLRRFAGLYGTMNERMEEHVRLFPVHPAYIDVLLRMTAVEKREILRTLSSAIARLLDDELPRDEPGVLAHDAYWATLRESPISRGVPAVREVIEKSEALLERLRARAASSRSHYMPVAIRIVQALSVHHLAAGEPLSPAGLTAEELRDDLCLHMSLPEPDADLLKAAIEVVLRDAMRAVSGQLLSLAAETGRYYLDLKKNIDFDALIERRGETLDAASLDRHFFDVLRRLLLDDPDAPPAVSGYLLWERDIEWRERRITRRGYLFFGAPSERPTSQRDRDFYLYFLPIHEQPAFTDERRRDEVFFRLAAIDDDLRRAIRLYAGAREMALTASPEARAIYDQRATEHRSLITDRLREQALTGIEVNHRGAPKKLAEVLFGAPVAGAALGDLVHSAASACLAPCFTERAPEYPTFSSLIPHSDRLRAAEDAVRWITGGAHTERGAVVLRALSLLDADHPAPDRSRYARHVLDLLAAKGPGQVLHRSEILRKEAGDERDTRFGLEPPFVAVVLAALVRAGMIGLSVPRRSIDAASFAGPSRIKIADLVAFTHIEHPRRLAASAMAELFDAIGIPRSLLFSGANSLSRPEQEVIYRRLNELRAALESARSINTPGEREGSRRGGSRALPAAAAEPPGNNIQRAEEARAQIECLGRLFRSDEERRACFKEELREALSDPAFRSAPGFPLASDEVILALSDPPYFTACPNPFITTVLDHHHRTPAEAPSSPDAASPSAFTDDISGTKHSPLYNVHPYHTKVPPEAIAPLIEHYTRPGDVILDPFAGSGMTALAVEMCDKKQPDAPPRTAIAMDLSPIATFIASTYNAGIRDRGDLLAVFDRAVERMTEQGGDYFTTAKRGIIRYVVWADIYRCPICAAEVPYWPLAVRLSSAEVLDVFACPSCSASLCKEPRFQRSHAARLVERPLEMWHDPLLGKAQARPRRAPALISYEVNGERFEKTPDAEDLEKIARSDRERPALPAELMMRKGATWGDTWRAGCHAGITAPHQFFTNRTLLAMAAFLREASGSPRVVFALTACLPRLSRMNRYMPQHRDNRSREVVGPLSGTLYIPSLGIEVNPAVYLRDKRSSFKNVWTGTRRSLAFVSTQSSTDLRSIPDASVDYIFTDPPFGDNLSYSELSSLWEWTIRCHTDPSCEAVVSPARRRDIDGYSDLLRRALRECLRVLKPGRWITVEFHNARASVWAAIQGAIEAAGFIIAEVRTLDKKKGTTKQLTSANAVRQDLLISAYKPAGDIEERAICSRGSEESVWAFVQAHLAKLPLPKERSGRVEPVTERRKHLLYDRAIAFHLQRGAAPPLSAADFYAGLSRRLAERDGMYFLTEQVAAYDDLRARAAEAGPEPMPIADERSAIDWLRRELLREPQTYQKLQPKFLKELRAADHEAMPELSKLLEQSFLDDEKKRWRAPDPARQADMEKLREKDLLREFNDLRRSKQKAISSFRTECLRAGFKAALAKGDHATIISVAAMLPEGALAGDRDLCLFYDIAKARIDAR